MTDEENKKQMITLEPEQIQQAAELGATLLVTPGAVNVPSHLALSGNVQVLNLLLMSLAKGQIMVVPTSGLPPEDSPKEE